MTPSARARLFVALELPVSAARLARGLARSGRCGGCRGVRPVADESLHVTLCFLGSGAGRGNVDGAAVRARWSPGGVSRVCVWDGGSGCRRVGRGALAVEPPEHAWAGRRLGFSWCRPTLSAAGCRHKLDRQCVPRRTSPSRGLGERPGLRLLDVPGGLLAEQLEFSGSTGDPCPGHGCLRRPRATTGSRRLAPTLG